MFKDKTGTPTVGFCLWCNRDFYSMSEHNNHVRNMEKVCPEFRASVSRQSGPMVGIFWLLGSRAIVDSTSVEQAGNYGDFKIHEGDHLAVWTALQGKDSVPTDSDYEEYPRGRVVFNRKTGAFTLYADRCILRKKTFIAKLLSLMHLPATTELATDEHYQCYKCLRFDLALD